LNIGNFFAELRPEAPNPRSIGMSASVKGFGCRPGRTIRARSEGRRPKASEEGTREPPGWRLVTMGI